MQRWGTIIQFMFENIHENKVLHQQQAKTTAKSVILGASPKWGDLGVPTGQKVAAVIKIFFLFPNSNISKNLTCNTSARELIKYRTIWNRI